MLHVSILHPRGTLSQGGKAGKLNVNIAFIYALVNRTKMNKVIAHYDENHKFREKGLIMLTYGDTMSFTKAKETFIIDISASRGSIGNLKDKALLY